MLCISCGDNAQGPSWSSVDVDGHWRLLHYALRRSFAPLLVSGVHDAASGSLEVHVTSDLPHPLQGEDSQGFELQAQTA